MYIVNFSGHIGGRYSAITSEILNNRNDIWPIAYDTHGVLDLILNQVLHVTRIQWRSADFNSNLQFVRFDLFKLKKYSYYL